MVSLGIWLRDVWPLNLNQSSVQETTNPRCNWPRIRGPCYQDCLWPLKWLTNSIIDADQKLLQRASETSGFQSATCGRTMTFNIMTGEFIQILHTGNGHCVTISTIGTIHPTVNIYDSLYSTAGTSLQSQIACFLAPKEAEITLNFMNVSMQSGTSDCGVFAIAFATAVAQGAMCSASIQSAMCSASIQSAMCSASTKCGHISGDALTVGKWRCFHTLMCACAMQAKSGLYKKFQSTACVECPNSQGKGW